MIFVCTDSTKIFFSKLRSAGLNYNLPILPNKVFVYAKMVPSWADQLLLQLLMEQFDTLPIQCRHIEDIHEGI